MDMPPYRWHRGITLRRPLGRGWFSAAKAGPGRLKRFTVAAFAALRLPCGPGACRRQGVRQAQNSPKGLFCVRAHCIGLMACRRTHCAPFGRLRSNSCDKLVYEARFARGHETSAPQRQGQRPWPSPGTNSPQDCLCPGSATEARLSLPGPAFAPIGVAGFRKTTARRDARRRINAGNEKPAQEAGFSRQN